MRDEFRDRDPPVPGQRAAARIAACSTCSTPTGPSSTSRWPGSTTSPACCGPQFRRVTLTNENRFGLLGKGAVLLRTSYGDRTSPVLRGAWVLDRIMGTPPTPPPPGVVDRSVDPRRTRQAHHRARPARSPPREPHLQGLPWPDRSARPRAGELRRDGTLARRSTRSRRRRSIPRRSCRAASCCTARWTCATT